MCVGAHVPRPQTNKLLKEEKGKKGSNLCATQEHRAVCEAKEASGEAYLAAILILEFTASRPVGNSILLGVLPGCLGVLFWQPGQTNVTNQGVLD